jgi:hypothetical protein
LEWEVRTGEGLEEAAGGFCGGKRSGLVRKGKRKEKKRDEKRERIAHGNGLGRETVERGPVLDKAAVVVKGHVVVVVAAVVVGVPLAPQRRTLEVKFERSVLRVLNVEVVDLFLQLRPRLGGAVLVRRFGELVFVEELADVRVELRRVLVAEVRFDFVGEGEEGAVVGWVKVGVE